MSPLALVTLGGISMPLGQGCFSDEAPPVAPGSSSDSGSTGGDTTDSSAGAGPGTDTVDADSTADSGTGPGAMCGNGVVDDGEACDDGNDDDSDACTVLCQPPACDDGLLSGNEADVDCGGDCDACTEGSACTADADCESVNCYVGVCASPCTPWTRQFGTSAEDVPRALFVEADGTSYITGWTDDALDGQPNTGVRDIFFSKFDPSGRQQFTRLFGSPQADGSAGIAVDGDGNIVVAGESTGAVTGGMGHSGAGDVVVAKYDDATTEHWVEQLGTPTEDLVRGVSLTESGNIYVVGTTDGGFDGPNLGSYDALLLKRNADGDEVWSVQLGTASSDEFFDVVTTSDGGVVVVGASFGEFDGNTSFGGADGIAARFDADGTQQWSLQVGGPGADYIRAVAIDPTTEDIVMVGYTDSSFEGNAVLGGGRDAFVLEVDAEGTVLWTGQHGSGEFDSAFGVEVDAEGTIYMIGASEGNLPDNVNAGGEDISLYALAPDGAILWTRLIGTAGNEGSLVSKVDGDGHVYIAAYTTGALEGSNAGSLDIAMMRICAP